MSAADNGSHGVAKGRVFVCYRSEEAVGIAAWLNEIITTAFGPQTVFVDKADLRGGEEWWRRIQNAIAGSSVMVVVIGKYWLQAVDRFGRRLIDDEDDWVRNEIRHALEAKVTLIPLLLSGAKMPEKEALPRVLQPMLEHHALEFYEQNLTTLKGALIGRLEELGFVKQPSNDDAGERQTDVGGAAIRRHILVERQVRFIGEFSESAYRARNMARFLLGGQFGSDEERRNCEDKLLAFHGDLENMLFRERAFLPQNLVPIVHAIKWDVLYLLMHVRAEHDPESVRNKLTNPHVSAAAAYDSLSTRFDELMNAIAAYMGV